MIDENIIDLIPQREPFVMVDELVSASDNEFVSRLKVRADNLFVADDAFTEPGMIENIAQTAAAGTGYMARLEGKPVAIGFIGAVTGLKVNFCPKLEEVLETTVTILHEIGDARVARGIIYASGNEAAQCELKIFLQG